MARILVFQHGSTQPPGRLGATLRDHGFQLDIRRTDLTPEQASRGVSTVAPTDLDGVHGVVCLGGSQSPVDPHPYLETERACLRAAHEKGLPVVGICLGHQLLAQALGGEIAPLETPRAGLVPVNLTVPAQTETITAGIAWNAHQFQAHHHHVTKVPPGAMVLATSEGCPVEAFRLGHRTFGFQYNFACDQAMIERFAAERPALFADAGCAGDQLDAQLEAHYEMFARLSDRLCLNLAAYAFPFAALTAV